MAKSTDLTTKSSTTEERQLTKQSKEVQDLHYALINQEEQYSLWPDYKAIPEGWRAVFGPSIKEECLAYIEKVWVDMRPLSLRRQMAELEKKSKVKTEAKSIG